MLVLGGSLVAGWTDDVVAWMATHRPGLTCAGIPLDMPDAPLAPFALVRHRHHKDVVCATVHDTMLPTDPRLATLLADVQALYADTPQTVVSIRAEAHESFARRMTLGMPGTFDETLAAQDVLPRGLEAPVDRVFAAPPYAHDTPMILDAILRRAVPE